MAYAFRWKLTQDPVLVTRSCDCQRQRAVPCAGPQDRPASRKAIVGCGPGDQFPSALLPSSTPLEYSGQAGQAGQAVCTATGYSAGVAHAPCAGPSQDTAAGYSAGLALTSEPHTVFPPKSIHYRAAVPLPEAGMDGG